jgi:hypothetical protein
MRPRVGATDMSMRRRSVVFPGARGPGEELEGSRLDREGHVVQHLGSHAVADADVLELHHRPLGDRLAVGLHVEVVAQPLYPPLTMTADTSRWSTPRCGCR